MINEFERFILMENLIRHLHVLQVYDFGMEHILYEEEELIDHNILVG